MAEVDGMNGADVLLLVNTGTEVSPAYAVVGSQTNVRLQERVGEVDMSSKDTGSMRVLGGRYDATITLDALYVPDDAAYLALKTAFRAKDKILVRVSESDVEVEEASALITAMDRAAPDQQPTTLSVTIRVDGDWSEVGS